MRRGRHKLVSALMAVLLCGLHARAQNPEAVPAPPAPSADVSPQVPALPTPHWFPPFDQESAMRRYAGHRVREVQFRGMTIAQPEKLRALLAQTQEAPLDEEKIRASVRALYQTGRYADVSVEAESTATGEVVLIFNLKPNYFTGTLHVSGGPKAPPTVSQLLNAANLQLGEQLTSGKLEAATAGVQSTLAANGYRQASVTVAENRNEATQQDDLLFRVVPGLQARVGAVEVTGDAGAPTSELQEAAELEPGRRVDGRQVTNALERLQKKYQRQDRLAAEVAITTKSYQPSRNTVDYALHINRGPRVEISLQGAKLSQGSLKKYVPVYEENTVDEDLLNEGQRNLRDYFQTLGYFDAEIEHNEETDAAQSLRRIIYTVRRGLRHKLKEVRIEGNHYFDTALLRERLSMRPASLQLRHGRYSQSLINRDAQTLANLYKANGYESVKVIGDAQDDHRNNEGYLIAVLHIEEGPQSLVSEIHFSGNQSVLEPELLAQVNTTPGQPFSDANVAADRDALLNFYFNRGFPSAQIESQATPAESAAPAAAAAAPRMRLSYLIHEGPQMFVNRIFLAGLQTTRPYIAQREVQFHEGDPLSLNDMLDTQQRLYDLGIFNQVDVAVQNPEGREAAKNVLLQAEEGKRWTFNYGFGMEVQTGSAAGSSRQPQGRTGFSPRVSFDVTRTNFRGRNQTVIFKSRYGRLEQLALLSYESPRLLDRENWKLIFTTFYDNTRDVRTFTAQRLEGSIQAVQKINKSSTILYGFTYRHVKVSQLEVGANAIPLLSKPVRIGEPTLAFIRDRRDDPLDAHKGNYTTLNAGIALGAFGSEASFSRWLLSNSTYHTRRGHKWIFARSTQIGVENPNGSTNVIPLPERFYAGGAYSLRGFSFDQAGPRDLQTGFPLGGNALFVNQLELRFPPFTLPYVGDNLSTVIFHDAGNVFSTGHDMLNSLFRVTQRNRQQCENPSGSASCDFGYLSHDVGLGLRYRTPLGPVRADFGYNLNPPVFPIGQENRVDRLRRFNFFFSLGQSF